jgi:hypothetical protein
MDQTADQVLDRCYFQNRMLPSLILGRLVRSLLLTVCAPSKHFLIPPTTSIAPQSTVHTSRKTQMVHGSLLFTPPVQRMCSCMKPLSHQNPTSMMMTTLSSLPQTRPLLCKERSRDTSVPLAWDTTTSTRRPRITHLPDWTCTICQRSSRRKKITTQEL